MDSSYLLILCLLLPSQLQPTPATQEISTLALYMQHSPPTYFPFCLHSLQLTSPSFIHECPSCAHSSLPPYRTLHSQVSFINSFLKIRSLLQYISTFFCPSAFILSSTHIRLSSVPFAFMLTFFSLGNWACFPFSFPLCWEHEGEEAETGGKLWGKQFLPKCVALCGQYCRMEVFCTAGCLAS